MCVTSDGHRSEHHLLRDLTRFVRCGLVWLSYLMVPVLVTTVVKLLRVVSDVDIRVQTYIFAILQQHLLDFKVVK